MSESGVPLPPNPALDRLLSDIYIRMRQGKYAEAAERLAKAKEIAPEHPAVVEIEGDIAFAQGRFHKAKELYKRAFDADPKNGKLEEKFATALLRTMMPQMMAHNLPDDSPWSNRVPRNPVVSTMISLFVPGFGQIYNGDWLKGLLVILASLILGIAESNIIWKAVVGARQANAGPAYVFDMLFHGPQAILAVLLFGLWVYGMVDAWLVAKDSKQ